MIVEESEDESRRLGQILLDFPESATIFTNGNKLAHDSFAEDSKGWICILSDVASKDSFNLSEPVNRQKDIDKGWEFCNGEFLTAITHEPLPKSMKVIKYLTHEYGCLDLI